MGTLSEKSDHYRNASLKLRLAEGLEAR